MMEDFIKDAFERISFEPPRTFPEMRAWKDVMDAESTKLLTSDVFEAVGISGEKIKSFKKKLKHNSFNNSDRKKWSEYQRNHTTEIRYILSILNA
jgi:hypothetical protein